MGEGGYCHGLTYFVFQLYIFGLVIFGYHHLSPPKARELHHNRQQSGNNDTSLRYLPYGHHSSDFRYLATTEFPTLFHRRVELYHNLLHYFGRTECRKH